MKKQTVYIALGAVAVAAVAIIVVRRNAGQNTTTVQAAPEIPSYNPMQVQYVPSTPTAPAIIGANPQGSPGSPPPGVTLAAVTLNPAPPPVHVNYPTDTSNVDVPASLVNTGSINAPGVSSASAAAVDTIYQMEFGRHAEPAGLAYWAGKVDNGQLSVADLTGAIANGAQNSDVQAEKTRVPLIAAIFGPGTTLPATAPTPAITTTPAPAPQKWSDIGKITPEMQEAANYRAGILPKSHFAIM